MTYRFDISVQEPNGVDLSDSVQDLQSDAHRRAQTEALFRRLSPQISQILALQTHHQVVELVVPSAPVEFTRVFFA